MTVAWDPGGGREELAYGAEETPQRRNLALAGAGAAGLVVGFLAGTQAGPSTAPVADPVVVPARPAAPTDGPTRAGKVIEPVAAGVVRPVAGEPSVFEVSLFNAGRQQLTATVVSVPGWAPALTDTRASDLAPRSWGTVRFSAPPDCLTYPAEVRVVHVRLWTDQGVDNQIVPLSEPASALREHFAQMCDPPPTR